MCVSASLGQRYPMVSQSTTGSITMKFTQSYSPLRYRWRPGPLWDRLWRHGVAGVLTASEIACVGWWWRSHGASFRIPKQTSLETTFLTFASWRAGSHVNDIANIFTLSSVILLISPHPPLKTRHESEEFDLNCRGGLVDLLLLSHMFGCLSIKQLTCSRIIPEDTHTLDIYWFNVPPCNMYIENITE